MRLSTHSFSLKCAVALSISEAMALAYNCDIIFILFLVQELGLCTAMNHIVNNLDIKGIFSFPSLSFFFCRYVSFCFFCFVGLHIYVACAPDRFKWSGTQANVNDGVQIS